MTRRILGLLLTITLMNVTVGGSNLACAIGQGSTPVAAEGSMPGMHHDRGDRPSDTKPCEAPARTCCDATVSCAVALALPVVLQSHDAPRVVLTITGPSAYLPIPRLVAPDPPPPKG